MLSLRNGEGHDHVVVSVHVKRAIEEEPVEVVEGEEVAEGDVDADADAEAKSDEDKDEDKSSGDDS